MSSRANTYWLTSLAVLAVIALAGLFVVIFVLETWPWRIGVFLGVGTIVYVGFMASTFYFAAMANAEGLAASRAEREAQREDAEDHA